jgi:predicted NUDIX family NTP pyrophosphohydrolase
MKGISAGILLYREMRHRTLVLLVHPGGPFWARKDLGAWSIPKGEIPEGEPAEVTARREFEEELGIPAQGELVALGEIRQKGGKVVHAWAMEGDLDASKIHSNTFQMEWPPRSGKMKEFPEVDRAEFFPLEEARKKINPAQAEFLERLERILAGRHKPNR